jgi:hypothetical protein
MGLFEVEAQFGKLPEKAGLAKLHWDGNDRLRREGSSIYLTRDDVDEFVPLRQGEQFIFHYPNGRGGRRVFFGGTDEKPFLVELFGDVITGLRGEADFFERLKPSEVSALEQFFKTSHVRQGDWFAVPIPLTWDQLYGCMQIFHESVPGPARPRETKAKGIQVGGTRHVLIGQFLQGSPGPLIAEGVLKAPDHADRVLKGPHAFYQTRMLANAQNAD